MEMEGKTGKGWDRKRKGKGGLRWEGKAKGWEREGGCWDLNRR